MANLLGVPSYDSSLDRENMQIQAAMIQQLGAQVRSDMTAIQTNRQLQGLAEGLQSTNPDSPEFPKQAVGLMMQYPLAAKSPIGTAAIQQLGAQHKMWQQEELKRATGESYFNIPGTDTLVSRKTGNTRELPEGTVPRKPFQVIPDAYGNRRAFDPSNFNQEVALDNPIKTSEDAVELENIKQKNRLDLQARKPSASSGASPEEKAISAALTKATIAAGEAKAQAERYQQIWESTDENDAPSASVEKRTNKEVKWAAGDQANALRKEAAAREKEARELAARLKSLRPAAIIPGLNMEDTPTPVAPIQQLGTAPAGQLMEDIPVQPTLQQFKRRRFNPSTGTLE